MPALVLVLGALSASLIGCIRYQARPLSPASTAEALEHRSLDDPGLRALLERHRALSGSWPPVSWSLEALTYVALYYHPALEVARAQWSVAQAAIKTAGGRPNPTLSLVPGYSLNPLPDEGHWLAQLTIDIPIETAGKRAHRIHHAEQLSEAARLELAAAAWQVRGQLRAALLDLVAAQRRATLLQAQLEAQQEVIKLLDQRLAAGAVAATEVTPSRIAHLRTLADLGEARRQQAEARARLASALGLPLRALAGLRLAFELPLSAEAGSGLTTRDCRRRALLGRPDVLATLARYAAAERALQLEVAKQYPDVHIGPSYKFDQNQHKWMLGLGLELPLFNHNQGPIAEAEARRALVAAQLLAQQASVIAAIDRALAVREATQLQLKQSEAIVAAQRRQQWAMEAAFKAGGAGRLDLRIAEVETAASELTLVDAQIKAQQALGLLEEAVQSPLDLRAVERRPEQPAAEKR